MHIHKPARRGTAQAVPVPDWSKLCRNDHIEVHGAARSPMSGIIDMIAADRSVFWMIRDDGAGRTMVCSGDDATVVKIPPAHSAVRRQQAAA